MWLPLLPGAGPLKHHLREKAALGVGGHSPEVAKERHFEHWIQLPSMHSMMQTRRCPSLEPALKSLSEATTEGSA